MDRIVLRIVELRAQPHPHVVGRVLHRGERHLDIAGRRGEGRRDLVLVQIRIPQRVPACGSRVSGDLPARARDGALRRVQHHCGRGGIRRRGRRRRRRILARQRAAVIGGVRIEALVAERRIRQRRRTPGFGLDRPDGIRVVPLAVEHTIELVEQEVVQRIAWQLVGEDVRLELVVVGGVRPVRRAEGDDVLRVEPRGLLVVQPEMLAHPDLDRPRILLRGGDEPIHLHLVAGPLRIRVLGGIEIHPDPHAARGGADQRVHRTRQRDAIDVDVDPAGGGLAIDERHEAILIAVLRREVEPRIDRVRRIVAHERRRHVRVVGVLLCVGPDVVEHRHERGHELPREIDDLVLVVFVWILGHERGRAEVGARPFDDALPGENHQLPVADVAGDPLPHRDAGRLQLVELAFIGRVLHVGARVHDDADGHAAVLRVHERRDESIVFPEPDADVDTLMFVIDQIYQRRPAVLRGRIAQTFLRIRARREKAERNQRDRTHPGHCSNPCSCFVVVFIAAIDDYAMRTPATDGDVLGGPCIDEV